MAMPFFYDINSFTLIVRLPFCLFLRIFSIIDLSYNIIVKYSYDAYGNILEEVSNEIGLLNPFRYKGYYYDNETKLYYCNSRYYSSELCRFISIDSVYYLEPENINGLNLYCYCMNDPINNVDHSGHFGIVVLIGVEYIRKNI
ncbi:MAG: RHS repeat-associated core domain-containing protein [Bacilli bacterium]|nr:RHS repeat-associated core domain-containing protein [Bacilli bacterium]